MCICETGWAVLKFLFTGAPHNPRRRIIDNVMIIEGLTKQDTAVYQCNATNELGYAFRDFYLNVLGKCIQNGDSDGSIHWLFFFKNALFCILISFGT